MAQLVENLPANAGGCKRHGFKPWVRKISWRRKWQPIPVFLPGRFHGQRSLAGYSSCGHQKLDMTEHTCLSSWLKNVSHNLGEYNEVERDVYRCIHNIKHNYMLIFKIFKIFKISFRYFKLLLDHCRYKWFLYNIINHFVSDTVNKKMPNQIYTFWYMESRLNTIFYCTAE